jgi:hypothetical protein
MSSLSPAILSAGDGVITNTVNGRTWPTEHVLVPRIPAGKSANVEVLILKAIAGKQAKGGAAYASGKFFC